MLPLRQILCRTLRGRLQPDPRSAAFAQSGGSSKAPAKKPPADTAKEGQKKIDEIAEAAHALTGPAGNPECVWLGRRVVSLLWRDDLDTAFRHLDLYDRFGCPRAPISRPLSAAWSGKAISTPRPRKR